MTQRDISLPPSKNDGLPAAGAAVQPILRWLSLTCTTIVIFWFQCLSNAFSAEPDEITGFNTHWFAASDNAVGITGDIIFSSEKILFERGGSLTLKDYSDLLGEHPDFNLTGDPLEKVESMKLYKVFSASADLGANIFGMCGTHKLSWIEASITAPDNITPGELELSFFWGDDLPPTQGINSIVPNHVCGTMFYEKNNLPP